MKLSPLKFAKWMNNYYFKKKILRLFFEKNNYLFLRCNVPAYYLSKFELGVYMNVTKKGSSMHTKLFSIHFSNSKTNI